MAWIGLIDRTEGRFARYGLEMCRGTEPLVEDSPDALMVRGTLMLEAQLDPQRSPQVLLGLEAAQPWPRRLRLQSMPGGMLQFEHMQGDHFCRGELCLRGDALTGPLRISFSWDAPRRFGRLAVEQPRQGHVQMVSTPAPMPLPVRDAQALMLGGAGHVIGENVEYSALSYCVEPIGPQSTLAADVPVETPFGMRQVGQLRRGDLVETEAGGVVPVLHRVDRIVPARGLFKPLRLYAPYFGLEQDITVAPTQRLVIRGSDVDYMFGREAVLARAGDLLNRHVGRAAPADLLVHYSQVVLSGHETLKTAGTGLESLFLGRLRRDPERLAQSVLADVPRNDLPEHGQPAFPILRRFDAVTLADQRAA